MQSCRRAIVSGLYRGQAYETFGYLYPTEALPQDLISKQIHSTGAFWND